MIIPSYGLTATERVLPSFTLDWTTGLVQSTVDVTRAGVATFIGSNGAVQSASADTQRIDYRTGISGLLVEESRTNLLPYSIPDAAVPTGYTVSVASGTYTHTLVDGSGALLGFQQMVKHEQTDSGRSALNLVLGLSASTTYTLSIYVDTEQSEITSGNASILIINGYSDATGTTGASLADADENGRIAITFTTGADTSGNIRFGIGCSGNATGVLYMGGWQLEVGAFATSYIPTGASAVTRNADVATVTGTNFSDFFNPTEGTIVCEFNSNADPSVSPPSILSVSDGTFNNRHQHYFTTTSILYRVAKAGTANNISFSGYSPTADTLRTAYSYSDTFLLSALNGGIVLTNAQDPPDVVDRMYLGGSAVGGVGNSITIRKFIYYPHQLTAAELRAFSKQG